MSSSEFEIVENDSSKIITSDDSAESSEDDTAGSSDDENEWKNLKFDKNLEFTLKKHGLTKRNVKTIIHSILKDNTVQDILKASSSELSKDNVDVPEMRLTRSKCKSAIENSFKAPWPLSPHKGHFIKPKPKFTELPLPEDDEEDKEYEPKEEELLESDGDTQESEEPLQENILEKLESIDKQLEENLQKNKEETENLLNIIESESSKDNNDLISLRTRSKHPLTTTRLDFIEASFNPPDVTPDMYSPLNTDDNDWQSWLADLFKDHSGNLNSSVVSHDDDDSEADPDFNYLAEDVEIDKEDLRSDCAVRVTKKELNSLMDELNSDVVIPHGVSVNPHPQNLLMTSTPTREKLNFAKKTVDEYANIFDDSISTQEDSADKSIELDPEYQGMKYHQILWRKKKKKIHELDASVHLEYAEVQKKLLNQQLQMHIQLLLQTNLLTRNSREYSMYSADSKNLIEELNHFACNSMDRDNSAFNASNLQPALDLCRRDVPVSDFVTTLPKSLRKRGYLPLQENVASAMSDSAAFMYMELLPISSPVTHDSYRSVGFLYSEDSLIATSMEEFGSMTKDFASLCHEYYLSSRSRKMIKLRVHNVMSSHNPRMIDNPIKQYRLKHVLPKPDKSISWVTAQTVKSPRDNPCFKIKPYWVKNSTTKASISFNVNHKPPILKRLKQINPEKDSCPLGQRYSLETQDDNQVTLVPLPGKQSEANNGGTEKTKFLNNGQSNKPTIIQCNDVDSSSLYTSDTNTDISIVDTNAPLNMAITPTTINIQTTHLLKNQTKHVGAHPLNNNAGCSFQQATTETTNEHFSPSPEGDNSEKFPINVSYLNRPLDTVGQPGLNSKMSCSLGDINGSIKVGFKKDGPVAKPLKKRVLLQTVSKSETIANNTVKSWVKTSHSTPETIIPSSNSVLNSQTSTLNMSSVRSLFPCVGSSGAFHNPLDLSLSSQIKHSTAANVSQTANSLGGGLNKCIMKSGRVVVATAVVKNKKQTPSPTEIPAAQNENSNNADFLRQKFQSICADIAHDFEDIVPVQDTQPVNNHTNMTQRNNIIMQLSQESASPLKKKVYNKTAENPTVSQVTLNSSAISSSDVHFVVKTTSSSQYHATAITNSICAEDSSECNNVEKGSTVLNTADNQDEVTGLLCSVNKTTGVKDTDTERLLSNNDTESTKNFNVKNDDRAINHNEMQSSSYGDDILPALSDNSTFNIDSSSVLFDNKFKNKISPQKNPPSYNADAVNKSPNHTPVKRKRSVSRDCLKVKLRKTDSGFEAHRVSNRPIELSPKKRFLSRATSSLPQPMLEEDTMVQLDPARIMKEKIIAEAYLQKVQESIKSPELFVKFLEILTKFSSSMDAPPRLFFEVKNLLHDYPQLSQAFVPFLMPSQALNCKVFNEHKIYVKARKFLRHLEMHFKHDEEQLKKILAVYKNLSYNGKYSEKEMKNMLQPLLKNDEFLKEELNNCFSAKRPEKQINSKNNNTSKPNFNHNNSLQNLDAMEASLDLSICSSEDEEINTSITCLSDVNMISEDALSSSPFKRYTAPQSSSDGFQIDRPNTPNGLKTSGDSGSGDITVQIPEDNPTATDTEMTNPTLPVTPGKKDKASNNWTKNEDHMILVMCREKGGASKEAIRCIAAALNKSHQEVEKRVNFLIATLTQSDSDNSDDISSSDSE